MDQITKNCFDIKNNKVREAQKERNIFKTIADLSDDISLQFDKNVKELFPEEGEIFITNLKRCLNSEEPLVFEVEIMVGNEKRTFNAFSEILGYSSPKEIVGTPVFKFYKDIEDRKKLIDFFNHERRVGKITKAIAKEMSLEEEKNDEICFEARVLTVADVVEAMASHRPYRITPGLEYALKEIEKYSGKLFDQEVVKATLKLFKGGFSID